VKLWGKEKGRIGKQLRIIYASEKISLLWVVVQNDFLMLGVWRALLSGSYSLLAGKAQPTASCELEPYLGSHPP
jgi:hypothetical protein